MPKVIKEEALPDKIGFPKLSGAKLLLRKIKIDDDEKDFEQLAGKTAWMLCVDYKILKHNVTIYLEIEDIKRCLNENRPRDINVYGPTYLYYIEISDPAELIIMNHYGDKGTIIAKIDINKLNKYLNEKTETSA